MYRTTKLLMLLVTSLFLTACGGPNFIRPQSDELVLGSTSFSQVTAKMGEPSKTAALSVNNVPVKSATYSHAHAVPFSTILAFKTLVCVFDRDILVSYDYASSFQEERAATSINDALVKGLANGDTKSKVIATLGRPGGEAIYPVANPKGSSVLRYTYLESYRVPFLPTPRITKKIVTVKLDSNEVVTEISTVESKPE
jgi:outer membrane protein assembly factor BamE (lipoprotein component of BamABCDE complex)